MVEVGVELAVAFVVPRSFWQEPSIPRTGCHQGSYQGQLEALLPGWLRGLSWSPACSVGNQHPQAWGQSCCLVFPACPQDGARAGMPLPPILPKHLERALSGEDCEIKNIKRQPCQGALCWVSCSPSPCPGSMLLLSGAQFSCERHPDTLTTIHLIRYLAGRPNAFEISPQVVLPMRVCELWTPWIHPQSGQQDPVTTSEHPS